MAEDLRNGCCESFPKTPFHRPDGHLKGKAQQKNINKTASKNFIHLVDKNKNILYIDRLN